MSHKRLVQLMQANPEALLAHPEDRRPFEGILNMLRGLDTGTITLGQTRRILGYQAVRQNNDPGHQFLYRQAAAALRQMQHEEH
jgi:hypothetical protein